MQIHTNILLNISKTVYHNKRLLNYIYLIFRLLHRETIFLRCYDDFQVIRGRWFQKNNRSLLAALIFQIYQCPTSHYLKLWNDLRVWTSPDWSLCKHHVDVLLFLIFLLHCHMTSWSYDVLINNSFALLFINISKIFHKPF